MMTVPEEKSEDHQSDNNSSSGDQWVYQISCLFIQQLSRHLTHYSLSHHIPDSQNQMKYIWKVILDWWIHTVRNRAAEMYQLYRVLLESQLEVIETRQSCSQVPRGTSPDTTTTPHLSHQIQKGWENKSFIKTKLCISTSAAVSKTASMYNWPCFISTQ